MTRLAAAQMTLPGESLVDKAAFVRSVGFDGIELSARGDGHFAARVEELQRARDAGVEMPTAVVVHMDTSSATSIPTAGGTRSISSSRC